MLPRHDLLRTEVDQIHARCFSEFNDNKEAHTQFRNAMNGFSPLTEVAALNYAKTTYHSNIKNIVQHFNVEKNGKFFDVLLITGECGSQFANSKQVQASYRCVEKAMNVCFSINLLFSIDLK